MKDLCTQSSEPKIRSLLKRFNEWCFLSSWISPEFAIVFPLPIFNTTSKPTLASLHGSVLQAQGLGARVRFTLLIVLLEGSKSRQESPVE